MNVVFRTDASLDIGTGHVMRCLTLAEAIREVGAKCRFICREHPGNLLDLIRQRGFEAHALSVQQRANSSDSLRVGPGEIGTAHSVWLGADWATDAAQTKVGVGGTPVDWLIIDHYTLDVRWEQQLRPYCHNLMVIDDLADRPHDCDLLLDQNLGRLVSDYAGLTPPACTVLAGPKYAVLRPEFGSLRDYSLARRAVPQLKHLLIAMGGVDKDNATGKVLDILGGCFLPADCRITVVMGPHAPWLAQVRDMAAQLPWATRVLVNVQDMAGLMADSDLAIGAAGASAWERCSLGLPTLIVVLADNQRDGAVALRDIGAVLLLEEGGQLSEELHEKIAIVKNPEAILNMQKACCSVTDGSGATQVVNRMLNANR